MNRNKEYVLTCSCGCHEGMGATIVGGQAFLGFVTSDFYTGQEKFTRLKQAAELFLGKKVLKSILCSAEDLRGLRDFLMNTDYQDEDVFEKNKSHVAIAYDEDFGYTLALVSDQKKVDALKFKNYRLFDLALSREDRDLLVRRINYSLKKHERTYIELNNEEAAAE